MSREHIHVPGSLGDKVADLIAVFVGSWLCVALHTVWFVVWFVLRLDVALLTNVVSLEAIFLCIFLLMSQNRQSSKDHLRDDHEAQTIDVMAGNHDLLLDINKQQLGILNQEQGTRQALDLIAKRLDMLEIQARTTVYASGTPLLPPQGEQKKGKVS